MWNETTIPHMFFLSRSDYKFCYWCKCYQLYASDNPAVFCHGSSQLYYYDCHPSDSCNHVNRISKSRYLIKMYVYIIPEDASFKLSSATTFSGSQNFTLNITQEGNQTAGENYTLICSILPNLTGNVTNFKWFYEVENTYEIINSSNQAVINALFKSELLFTPLHESHTGTYICQGSYYGSLQSKSSHIMVNVIGMFLE